MLAGAGWLLLLSKAGFLLASMQPDCGGVLLPSVTGTILQYALPVTDSINGTRCSWTLHASSSETVELEIISYQTFSRTDTSCTAAYLAIKLGPSQRERRFCEPFRSIPEIGRKFVIRGKGPGVVTLRSPYGMKPGLTLRYSVLVPDANRRRIDSRTMELRTLTPLPSSVWGEGEQVHLSKGEAMTFSTSTGKGHQYILGYTSLSPVQERRVPPWTHQSSSSLGHSVPQAHASDQRLRSRVQLQTGEIPAKDSQSHLNTTFGPKALRTQTLPEKSKTSQGPGILKIAALSSSNPSLQLNLASIFTYPSGSDPHSASLSGSGPSPPSPTTSSPSPPSPTTSSPSPPSPTTSSPSPSPTTPGPSPSPTTPGLSPSPTTPSPSPSPTTPGLSPSPTTPSPSPSPTIPSPSPSPTTPTTPSPSPSTTTPGPSPSPTSPSPNPSPTTPNTSPFPTTPGLSSTSGPGPSSPSSSSPGPTSPTPSSPGPTSPSPTNPGPISTSPINPGLTSPTTPGPTSPSPTTPGPTSPSPSGPGPSSPSPTSPGQSSPSGPGQTSPSPSGPNSPSSPGQSSPSVPGPSSPSPSSPGPSSPSPSSPVLSYIFPSSPGMSSPSGSGSSSPSPSSPVPSSPSPSSTVHISPSPSSPGPTTPSSPSLTTRSPSSPGPSSPSPSSPNSPSSPGTNSASTLTLNSKPNLNSTLPLGPSLPFSPFFPESTTMVDNELSLKNFTPPSAVQNKDRQLTSAWSVEPTEMTSSEDDMATRSDANSRLVSTPLGGPKSPLKISGDLITTDQVSKAQSTGRIPPSLAKAFKVSSVTANLSADVVSLDQWRSSQQDHSDTYGITLSAHREIELVTRPQSRDKMEAPVTLTPAHDLSTHSSILVDEGVVEMSPGGGCANRVERSSTVSDTTWTESQDQNALPGVPAKPSELITPQSDQDRKQESESDQHTLFFSHITDIPTSESPSVQNANTENLVNSFKMNSVAGLNQPETTRWALNFKGTTSDFDGTVTPALSQVKIKSLSSSWNIFEFPELLTHSSNLPAQEVTNGAETDTATLSYESGPRGSERLPEIPPAVATLNGTVATQSAGSQFPVTGENALTTQGVSFANRIPSSISFTPGMSLVAISADGNGGEMVSSEVMEDSGGARGRGSETESTRDTPVEDGGNVTLFTIAKDSMTKAIATRIQRLEITPAAKSSSSISVIFDLSGTEKDVYRLKAVPDSMTEMMVTTEPSGKTIRLEGGTSPPSNSGGPNTDGSPTEGNFVSGDIVPSFSPKTPAPEPITPQPPANASLPSVGVDHSASPPKEIFPTTLPLTWLLERTSTVLEGSPSLTNSRGTIAPTSSKTTMPGPANPMSSSGRTAESQTSTDERLRETSAPVMNQAFQDATVLSRSVDVSGNPSFTPESLDRTWSATRPPTPPHLPVLTYSIVSVTNLAQLLPSVPILETVSQPSTDQTGIGSSQTLGSSSVSGRGEPAWPTTVNLKFTLPPPPVSSSVEEEENIATSEGIPLSWTLPVNQLGSEPTDGSPGPSVSYVDTKDLNNNQSQSPQPGGSEQWQREILSTLAAAHSATTEGFWTWGQPDLGTLSTGHGVVPTLGSSTSPEGTTSLPTAAVLSPRIPTTPTHNGDNSWTLGRDETSLSSPTPAMGTLTWLVPTSQPLHLDVNPTPSERAAQTTVHQPTQGTLGEVMTSAPSFTPTEKRKQIFIVGNELPLIKEGLTVKIPTKLILDMNFTLQLGDSTSEEYQNLAEDFTHKVSPFYKKVPGFQQLLVKHFSAGSVLIDFDAVFIANAGSVLIDFDAVFIAKKIQAYLLDLDSIFNITGLHDAISGRFEIGGARVLKVYISEDFIALCGEVFSCQTGFQCIHSNTGNVSCTSLCHADYCKNSGICTHNQGQEPMCQCPVGIDYWFMGPRCDHRMTRQSLIGIVFGVVLSLLLVMGAVTIAVLRRFKILLIEAKVDQTKSSYKRFSRFDDFSSQYQSQSWLNYSVSSLDNPGFSNSDELIHLQMLDSSYCYYHEESVTGTYSSWRTAPHDRSTFRHSLQNNLDYSISSINEHAGDSGKASDLSVYSWPIEPLQWSPFPILYQLNRDRPFKARRPRSYCEGMELVSMERNWTA